MATNIGDAYASSFGGPSQSSIDTAVNNRNQLENTLQSQNQGFLSGYRNDQNSLFQNQRNEFGGLVGQLQGVLGSQQKLPDLYSQYASQNNVPNLQAALSGITNQAMGVNDQLQNLTSDVNNRVRDSLVTDAQRRNEISNESVPLQTALGRLTQGSSALGQQLQTALGNTQNMVGLQQQQYQKDLMPIQTQINEFADQAAREFSGFNNEKQVEYTTLLDNLQRQRSMSDSDLARLRSLQDQAQQFTQSKNLLAQQISGNEAVARINASAGAVAGGQVANTYSNDYNNSATPAQPQNPESVAAKIFSLNSNGQVQGSPSGGYLNLGGSQSLFSNAPSPNSMPGSSPSIPLTTTGNNIDFSSMLGNNGMGGNIMNDPYTNSLRLRAGL